MKKRILFVFIFILLIALLVFLFFESITVNFYKEFKGRDWYIEIGNDYEIQKLNGNEIILVKSGWSANTDIVISNYINAYCSNDSYIGIWCAKAGPSFLPRANNPEDIYYLIDMQKDIIVGQYTKTEYEHFCRDQNIPSMTDWIYTT